MKILLIEDCDDVRTTMADVLELLGHTVRTAENGRLGIYETKEFRPDVILLDIGLPDIDGLEVARRIRSHGNQVHIVVISGRGYPKDIQATKEAGCNQHLVKPVNLKTLKTALAEVRTGCVGCAHV